MATTRNFTSSSATISLKLIVRLITSGHSNWTVTMAPLAMLAAGSAFAPRHTVNIIHPFDIEKVLGFERYISGTRYPQNSRNRYAPRPFIIDTAGKPVGPHTYEDERRIYSRHAAVPKRLNSPEMRSPPTCDSERLLRDMEETMQEPGETVLLVALLCRDSPPSLNVHDTTTTGHVRVCIYRTRVVKKDMICGGCNDCLVGSAEARYVFNLKTLDQIVEKYRDLTWLANINDVVYGISDRAVLHTKRQKVLLKRNFPIQWKTPRVLTSFRHIVRSAASPLQPPLSAAVAERVQEGCMVCFEPFDEAESQPLALHCNPLHIVCQECLVLMCQQYTTKHSNCPYCRVPMFKKPSQALLQMWAVRGLDLSGHYRFDSKLNFWENMERSVADIYSQAFSTADPNIVVYAPALELAMKYMLTIAKAEPEASTPRHMNAAYSDEAIFALSTVWEDIKKLNNTSITLSSLHSRLMKACKDAAGVQIVRQNQSHNGSGQDLVASFAQLNLKKNHGEDVFWTWLDRFLLRVIRFLVVRHCRCGTVSPHCRPGIHRHGARLYFDAGKMGEEAARLEVVEDGRTVGGDNGSME